MLASGVRDVGFAGIDWVEELGLVRNPPNGASESTPTAPPHAPFSPCVQSASVVQVLDTELDPVRIVAASPDPEILSKGGLGGRRIIVASEYEALTRRWLAKRGIDAAFLRAYGATESLPPEDADVIVDNAATGSTLKANKLEVFDQIMNSTTRLYASAAAWADPAKRARIEQLAVLLRSVLDARKRLMVTFNVTQEALEAILAKLPS